MRISSRTPEGSPNHCPVCGSDVRIEPSAPFGDAPCPNCGTLLWFVALPEETRLFEHVTSRAIQERVIEIVAERLGVPKEPVAESANIFEEVGADSLDVAELVMELEEEFGARD